MDTPTDAAELAVLKAHMNDVRSDISEIKKSTADIYKEIAAFILQATNMFQTKAEHLEKMKEAEALLTAKIEDVRIIATKRLWQASFLSLVAGMFITVFAALIIAQVKGS